MSRKTEQLIEEAMPDMEIVERSNRYVQDSLARRALKPGVSISELKKKYLGKVTVSKRAASDSISPEFDLIDKNVEVHVIQRKRGKSNENDREIGKRTIITSQNRGIIGSQG